MPTGGAAMAMRASQHVEPHLSADLTDGCPHASPTTVRYSFSQTTLHEFGLDRVTHMVTHDVRIQGSDTGAVNALWRNSSVRRFGGSWEHHEDVTHER